MSDYMVTIEGSVTPCAELARGERRDVLLTDRIKGLARKGFIVIVGDPRPTDGGTTELTPISEAAQAPPPPGPHTVEATGEPNVGTEVPADGEFHEIDTTPPEFAPAPHDDPLS